MKKILLTCFALAFALFSIAQERTITGTVTSTEDGTPLPGVNVLVKGTTIGTATDGNGKYSLSIPASGGSLVFSFIGLVSKEIEIGDRTVVDVSLALDITQLTEVVVVGYGVQEKRKVSSSISSVQGESIAKLATPNFAEQLAGRAAGVQITTQSGVIGNTPRVLVRGVNSITQGTFPLVVVDGIPMTTGNQSGVTPTNPLADINPADIESYEVLKDGAATAIYGSRAANGVILLTTKRGSKSKGKTNVDFTAMTGYSEAVKTFDLLNADQFEEVSNAKLANAGLAAAARRDPSVATSGETDWQDYIMRKGRFSNYNLSIGGAGESTNYYVSLGYQFQESSVRSNDFERFSFLTNIDHKVNKFIKIGSKLSMGRSLTTGLNTGSNALSGNLAGGLKAFPNVTMKDPNNPTGYNFSPDGASLGQGANLRAIDNNYTNQAFVLEHNKAEALTNRIMANIYGDINILDGLTFSTRFGVDYLANKDFNTLDPRHGDGRGSNGIVFNQFREVTLWNYQNTLSFNRDFGDHGIDFVAGLELQKQTFENFSATGSNFADIFFMQHVLSTGSFVTPNAGGGYEQTSYDSYFARLNYSYKDRYLFSISGRDDGLSRLSKATRRGFFPGASVGYRISEENFFKNSGVTNIVNDLKIRGSYAQVGNTEIGLFPYAALYGTARYGGQNGIAFTQTGNPDLTWETSKKLNVGADIGLMNNELSLSFDYFVNDVDGNILDVDQPKVIGFPFPGVIRKNIGIMRNSGVEFTVNAMPFNRNGFSWNVGANFTMVKNEVLSTIKNSAGIDIDINPGSYGMTARIGEPTSLIYGYTYAGVNPSNGNPMYKKGDGSIVQRNVNTGTYSYFNPSDPTNETNTAGAALSTIDVKAGGDRSILGNTIPKWYGGLTNTFAYKGLTLEIFTRFSGGNMVYNQTRQDNLLSMDFVNAGTELLNSWTPENTNTDVPKMWINRSQQVNQTGVAISRFVEKGDFLRIQNISLSYSLPKTILDMTGSNFRISSLRVFAQVQNAITFTKYAGVDPELGGGFDNNTNPIFRTYTFGVNLGL
jgi:TonB-dependent starch-binding outer membrane protein SusC